MNPPALTTLLADILGVPAATLGDATAMADVETWDSLRHIELVVRLEESCGIQLGPDDIVEMVTIGAIRAVLERGRVGETYCVGGRAERTNLDVVNTLCALLDELHPEGAPHARLITFVKDRPGHDRRYAIDCSKLETELGWKQQETFESGLKKTVQWYLSNPEWVQGVTSGSYRQWIEKNYGDRA